MRTLPFGGGGHRGLSQGPIRSTPLCEAAKRCSAAVATSDGAVLNICIFFEDCKRIQSEIKTYLNYGVTGRDFLPHRRSLFSN